MKMSKFVFIAKLFSLLSVIMFLYACASSQHINIVVSPKYYQKQQMNIAVLDFDYKKGDTVASLLLRLPDQCEAQCFKLKGHESNAV